MCKLKFSRLTFQFPETYNKILDIHREIPFTQKPLTLNSISHIGVGAVSSIADVIVVVGTCSREASW